MSLTDIPGGLFCAFNEMVKETVYLNNFHRDSQISSDDMTRSGKSLKGKATLIRNNLCAIFLRRASHCQVAVCQTFSRLKS